MSVVRKKTDHGSLAFLVEYKNTDEEIYYRELNALKLLKGKLIMNIFFRIRQKLYFLFGSRCERSCSID
jgi:hypothetical protein